MDLSIGSRLALGDDVVLLFCNGEPPSRRRLQSLIPHPSLVACADGGAQKARLSGYEPDIVVGDLDSLVRTDEDFQRTEIVEVSSQDNTDFEKALSVLFNRGRRNFFVVSFSGGRIDQTLANLQIAYEYSKNCRIALADEQYVIFPVTENMELNVVQDAGLSIIPMENETHISTDGLAYELHDAHLRKGGQGISNRALGEKIIITVHNGGVLVFLKDA